MHSYRITMDDTNHLGNLINRSLSFSVENYDNLFHIVETVRSKELVDSDKSAALALGLKLLSEAALEKRRHSLFASLSDSLRSFIQQLKTVSSAHP